MSGMDDQTDRSFLTARQSLQDLASFTEAADFALQPSPTDIGSTTLQQAPSDEASSEQQ
jgi:hypothetical protein